MKNIFTIIFIAIFFIGSCGIEPQNPWYEERYHEWQKRESSCPILTIECVYTGVLGYDLIMAIKQFSPIWQRKENGTDYWQTSCETIDFKEGDCEDMALLAYQIITNSCLMEYYNLDVRIRIYDIPESNTSHIITVIYSEDDFYEIDNFRVWHHESDYSIEAEFY